jgi:hypothetical protein
VWVTDAFEPKVCRNLDTSVCMSHPDAPVFRVDAIHLGDGRIDHRAYAERICRAVNFCAGVDLGGLPPLTELLDELSAFRARQERDAINAEFGRTPRSRGNGRRGRAK